MGFRFNGVFINFNGAGVLKNALPKSIEEGLQWIQKLGLHDFSLYTHDQLIPFDQWDGFWLTRYEEGMIFSSLDLCEGFFFIDTDTPHATQTYKHLFGRHPKNKVGGYANQLLNLFPDSKVLAIYAQSTIDAWGFAYYDSKQLIRMKAGCHEFGTFIDMGTPLPEEKPELVNSTVKDGIRMISAKNRKGEIEEFEEWTFGEYWVFKLIKRFTGSSPNEPSDHDWYDHPESVLFVPIVDPNAHPKPTTHLSPTNFQYVPSDTPKAKALKKLDQTTEPAWLRFILSILKR